MNHDTEWSEDTLDARQCQKPTSVNGTMQIQEKPDDDDDHDLAAEKLDEQNRNRTPLKYCVLIAENPKKAFALTLFGHICLVLVTVILVVSGYKLIPITFDRIPLEIRDQQDYLNHLSWLKRYEENLVIVRGTQTDGTQFTRTEVGDVVEIYFEAPDGGNLFTQKNLRLMKETEQRYWNNTEYRKSFCQLDPSDRSRCRPPKSILRLFDGSLLPIAADPDFQNISGVLDYAWKNVPYELYYFLGKEYRINGSDVYNRISRSRIFLGVPLPGYDNTTDRDDDQVTEIQDFTTKDFKKISNELFENSASGLNFFYSSFTLLMDAITSYVFKDMSLILGSLVFIICFLMFQTGSFWISLWAVFSIITGFFGANLVYRIIFDMRYFGIFHVLAIFILLCIGADDVFVFYDTWKMSAHFRYPSLSHRLSDTYRKAAGAMMFTSLTTAVAFAVSATSPLLGVSTFGIFSALLIVVNYISVVVFFPTVVISYHLFWEKYKCCCCCTASSASVEDMQRQVEEQPPVVMNNRTLTRSFSNKPLDGKRHNPVVRFFESTYFKFITHPVARWFILAAYLALTAFAIYEVTTLKINEEQVKFLKDSTNFGQYMSKSSTAFAPSDGDSTTYVMLTLGLKGQDLSSCHRTDHMCTGKTDFDDSFNLNTEESQTALLKLCKTIREMPLKRKRDLHINIDKATGSTDMKCFIEDMEKFFAGTNYSLPLNKAKVVQLMKDNMHIYRNYTNLPSSFDRYFEIGMSFWLYNGFAGMDEYRYDNYDDRLGEQFVNVESIKVMMKDSVTNHTWYYNYGTQLKFAAIAISTDLERATLGYIKGLPIRDLWEEFIIEQRALLPAGIDNILQTSYDNVENNLWHWLALQKVLVSSAIMGIAVGLAVAVPILIIATGNVIVGLMATVSIVLTTLCVIAIIPLGGWKLGLIESLNLTLVVGLSVDYVVHLAEGYSRSAHRKRLGRLQDTLRHVGISVLSGAVTTMGGSAFMLFAQILLFSQFGLFMFCTIGFSILFALGLFTTVLGIIGPEGECGKLTTIWKKITGCVKSSD